MKKTISILLVVMILSLGLGLNADDKELNVLADLGFAFSDVEGLFFDLGIEKQFKQNLFALLYLDYYFNPTGENFGAYGIDASLTLMGINLGAVYKSQLNEKIKWFLRAGLLLAISKATVTFLGYKTSDSASDFGIFGGAGIEYLLSPKLALMAGVALHMVFSDGTGTWFKLFYVIIYKLK